MDRRLKFDSELREVFGLEEGETGHIYFQPTEAVKMKYDAIVYRRVTFKVLHANDRSYNVQDQYEVIAITRDPDSDLPRRIQEHFQICRPGRQYVSDNLYHFPFTITY